MIRRAVRSTLSILAVATLSLGSAGSVEGQNPERWEENVLEFEAEDAVNPPPENAILITGSSSIARWHPNIREDLAGLTIIPRGFGGSRMSDLLHWVDRLVIQYRPRAVAIYEGDNDTNAGLSAETITGEFAEIVDRIHAELPDTRIYVLSVKPSVARVAVWPEAQRTNEIFQAMAARDDRIFYVDVATPLLQPNGEVMTDIFVDDDLHLNEKGEDIWAAAVREALLAGEVRYETQAAGHAH